MICYTDKHKIPFQIDEADCEAVRHYTWSINSRGRVKTKIGKWPDSERTIDVSTFLLGRAPHGREWDHKNRDPLDNRRSNLRAVTATENQRNRGKFKNNTSGLKGVQRSRSRWAAIIGHNGKSVRLGTYDSPEAAFVARRKGEIELWGSRA